jgi:hypothetical protein
MEKMGFFYPPANLHSNLTKIATRSGKVEIVVKNVVDFISDIFGSG